MFPYYTPHTPFQARDSLVQKYTSKTHDNGQFDPVYAAMMEILDRNVGRILESLERLGLAENSIVVFFSDNGTAPFVAPDKPFRGYKGTMYEGGIRVPLILRQPEISAKEKEKKWPERIDTHVIGTDLYPTLLDLAGINLPEDYPLDGQSLRPLLEAEAGYDHGPIFWHFPAYLRGEYGMTSVWRTTPVSAVRFGNFKLLEFLEDGQLELYDLSNDPGESQNLAKKHPEKTKEMFKLLNDWRKGLDISYPLEKNPDFDPGTIPDSLKTGDRLDIYKTSFIKIK